jgi:hypothetical protein
MSNKPSSYWESTLFRPVLPEGWYVEEQLEDARRSLITFVRFGRIHHKAEPSKIYVVLCEFNPNHKNKPKYNYTVRGGRNAKPSEDLHYFDDLKSAEKYIRYLCETTDSWLEDVNSPEVEAAYDRKIAAAVRMAEMPRS